MIGPVERGAPAPLLAAAAVMACGIGLGGWTVSGERLAVAAAFVSLVGALVASSRHARAYGAVGLLAAGFALGRSRVAIPASCAQFAWNRLDPDRPVRIVGNLRDFWTGAEGRRRTQVRAESITQEGRTLRFPADLSVYAFGAAPLPGVRGDRIALTVSIEPPED